MSFLVYHARYLYCDDQRAFSTCGILRCLTFSLQLVANFTKNIADLYVVANFTKNIADLYVKFAVLEASESLLHKAWK